MNTQWQCIYLSLSLFYWSEPVWAVLAPRDLTIYHIDTASNKAAPKLKTLLVVSGGQQCLCRCQMRKMRRVRRHTASIPDEFSIQINRNYWRLPEEVTVRCCCCCKWKPEQSSLAVSVEHQLNSHFLKHPFWWAHSILCWNGVLKQWAADDSCRWHRRHSLTAGPKVDWWRELKLHGPAN